MGDYTVRGAQMLEPRQLAWSYFWSAGLLNPKVCLDDQVIALAQECWWTTWKRPMVYPTEQSWFSPRRLWSAKPSSTSSCIPFWRVIWGSWHSRAIRAIILQGAQGLRGIHMPLGWVERRGFCSPGMATAYQYWLLSIVPFFCHLVKLGEETNMTLSNAMRK